MTVDIQETLNVILPENLYEGLHRDQIRAKERSQDKKDGYEQLSARQPKVQIGVSSFQQGEIEDEETK